MLIQPEPQPESTLIQIIRLLRWDKPAGRLILMIPALWAVFLASDATPPWVLVLVIIFGTVATSAAGCVVNDLWDRDIDPEVERTRSRPLAS
ncbi:ubiA prenyltransferase family protein, partial [Lyngbya aestuarii BL J]